jgi:3-deoxy-D-arabino-heptulosonate 7-phosphate (DAHP) synthase
MNKEYWQAKADLCQKIGIEQLMEGDIKNGTRNLKRMVRAMEELNLIKANEAEDKSASDMWASLIASGAILTREGESNELHK